MSRRRCRFFKESFFFIKKTDNDDSMKYLIFSFILFWNQSVFAQNVIDKFQAYSINKEVSQVISLQNGKLSTVAIFLSKDCPCSKGNLDYINELSKEFPEFQFIGIHSKKNTSNDEIKSYLKDKPLHFDIYNDSDLKIADLFKALKTPHAFILNPQGEIVYNGGITNSTFPKNAKEFFFLLWCKNHF